LVLGLVWVAFLPNAPYLVTDLIHVERSTSTRAVADASTISLFALTGLLLAYSSLLRVQALINQRVGAVAGWTVVLGALLLSGAGIYLGRVHRHNSWDMIVRPESLLATMKPAFDPLAHVGALFASAVCGALLVLAYILAHCTWMKRELRLRDIPGCEYVHVMVNDHPRLVWVSARPIPRHAVPSPFCAGRAVGLAAP
jgi:uncharacterized membrane protein